MLPPERRQCGAAQHAPVDGRERGVLRDLARKVAEAAADSRRMEPIRRRWLDVNALRRPDRAPVWCKPTALWQEFLPPQVFVCQDPLRREIEGALRRILFKVELDDDTPIAPFFPVPVVLAVEPADRWGVKITRHSAGVAGGASAYAPVLAGEADFDKLRRPAFRIDEAATRRRFEQVGDLLGDLLPPRRVCLPPLSATYSEAAELRGLEQIMLDAIEAPALLHRLMAHLRDANLAAIDAMERDGGLTPNHDIPDDIMGPSIFSEPLAPAGTAGATASALWCAANSQEFDQVSPAMWEEFCLAYQKPVFARFGRVCYGCCENLTRKLDGVLSIPNLRIVVCSAWTDREVLLTKVPADRYVIMWRQKASDVCVPDDDRKIRADLFAGARQFRGRRYQIVLRELETLMGHEGRLHAWVRHAKEAAAAGA